MDFVPVKEFARRAGVSAQAIYQRIDKDLKKYCKEVDGKKMLDTSALQLFSLKANEKEVDNGLIKTLQDTLTVLSSQLESKDRQITELNKRLAEANELNKNNQILIGRQQQIETTGEPEQHEPAKKSFWGKFRKD